MRVAVTYPARVAVAYHRVLQLLISACCGCLSARVAVAYQRSLRLLIQRVLRLLIQRALALTSVGEVYVRLSSHRLYRRDRRL